MKEMKICSKCKQPKEYEQFYYHPKHGNEKSSHCKSCEKNRCKVHRNDDYIRTRSGSKNLDIFQLRIREKMRLLYQKRKNRSNDRKKERLKTDINFRLSRNLRCRLSIAIKRGYKKGSAVSDLGCSIEEFKIYLESKFQSGMSWSNWGINGWHIDHIKPLSMFDLSNPEQLKQACHYTNLQPLWAKDNWRKYNK